MITEGDREYLSPFCDKFYILIHQDQQNFNDLIEIY